MYETRIHTFEEVCDPLHGLGKYTNVDMSKLGHGTFALLRTGVPETLRRWVSICELADVGVYTFNVFIWHFPPGQLAYCLHDGFEIVPEKVKTVFLQVADLRFRELPVSDEATDSRETLDSKLEMMSVKVYDWKNQKILIGVRFEHLLGQKSGCSLVPFRV
ncbi:MAG TPA: hypothetical protein VNH18_08290 [Bryobacteraceae bacterium]|nr:hypothetical protein [Bryobacteraceae bacterium]HXJ39265.1 hypothetical protein [Bryobacteraceae bacterium]